MDMESEDVIEVWLEQQGGKPVIRIYSEQRLVDVVVSLDLRKWIDVILYPRAHAAALLVKWTLSSVEAACSGRSSELVHPDVDGVERSYDFLFWEGSTRVHGCSDFCMKPEDAVCVASDALASGWLQDKLLSQGLNVAEATEMATHWLPLMSARPYVLVSFLPQDVLERHAPLALSPAPQLLLRVFMLFSPVDEARSPHARTSGAGAPDGDRVLLPSVRPPYTVVEWGGMCVLPPTPAAA